jgi:hypothetical protein
MPEPQRDHGRVDVRVQEPRRHKSGLIGKTREQLRSLHFRRDRDWLQS